MSAQDAPPRPFSDYLRELAGGKLSVRLASELQKVVKAVGETGMAGKLTLVLDFKPTDTSGDVINVQSSVKATIPKPAIQPSLYYRQANNNLTRRDPQQADIEDILGGQPAVAGGVDADGVVAG